MSWDLSNILSAIGIAASVINIFVVVYIYTKWTDQKQKEVVANDAGILMEEIESLRQNIIKAHTEGTVDDSFILYIEEKKDEIGSTLGMIQEINKSLVYAHYIHSLSLLITDLQVNPHSISKKNTLYSVLLYTVDLNFQLRRLRLYI